MAYRASVTRSVERFINSSQHVLRIFFSINQLLFKPPHIGGSHSAPGLA